MPLELSLSSTATVLLAVEWKETEGMFGRLVGGCGWIGVSIGDMLAVWRPAGTMVES